MRAKAAVELENIFRNIDWDRYGLNINGNCLNYFQFTDKMILSFIKKATILGFTK